MHRRAFLASLASLAATPLAAQEQSFADAVADELRAQGYDDVQVRRTFLGRTRIRARRDGVLRELIVSEGRGAILRDAERAPRDGDRPRWRRRDGPPWRRRRRHDGRRDE